MVRLFPLELMDHMLYLLLESLREEFSLRVIAFSV